MELITDVTEKTAKSSRHFDIKKRSCCVYNGHHQENKPSFPQQLGTSQSRFAASSPSRTRTCSAVPIHNGTKL
jgi:predicted dinucleotide-utilizing enzyme